jgi:hypothetical protein
MLALAGFPVPSPADLIRRPAMPDAARFALFRTPANAHARPVVYPTLGHLARGIHRARGRLAIELQDNGLLLEAGKTPTPGVSIWTVMDGARVTFIGWAYLGGAGREALQAAIAAEQPQPVRRAA